MGATISSSDAETRFFMPDEMAIVSAKSVLDNQMRTTQSIYYFDAIISESENEISRDSYAVKEASNLTILEAFKHLKDDWNGYGAKKFDPIFIDKIKDMVVSLEYSPKIFPTGRGSVQLEFNNKNGHYLEIEIFEDGNISYLFEAGDTEDEGNMQFGQINPRLEAFYA